MSIKRAISEVDGVEDKKVHTVLKEMKAVLEAATGRLPTTPPIVKLGADATLAGVINKVNEVIKRLQED